MNNTDNTTAVSTADGGAKPPRVAEQIVRLALERYRLGRTDKDEPFAVPHDGPNVALLLRGSLRAKLARDFRAATGYTPSASALADAITALEGEALSADPEPVALRLAAHADGVVIDIGDAEGRAVIVTPNGWQVLPRSPVLFQRTALTAPLPVPERGGTLDELRDVLNVSHDTWPLVVGWLVAALLPDIPHPVLLLAGLQGTGKSSAARMLVTLIDPSAAPLRSEPRNLDDWQVAAAGSWVVALDNVSRVQGWFSDALCRAVTGDGLVKRELYSDANLAVLAFRRVLLMTSIDPGALRGDLAERLLLVDLEALDETARRTEAELTAAFESKRARLLGSLLDAVARVLAALPSVRLDRLPRMADFARVLAACNAGGVTNNALGLYLAQAKRVAAEVVDGDPFATTLVQWIRARGSWRGTATELLRELLQGERPPSGWPVRPEHVSGRLKRLIPALAAEGVSVTIPRERTNRGRIIAVEMFGKTASPASPASLDRKTKGFVSDASSDARDATPGRSVTIEAASFPLKTRLSDASDASDASKRVTSSAPRNGHDYLTRPDMPRLPPWIVGE